MSKDSRYRQPDYECRFCPGLVFRGHDWHRRNAHLRTEHRMRITWGCPVCTYRQSSRRFTDLLNHVRAKHSHHHGQPIPELESIDGESLSPSPHRRQSPRRKSPRGQEHVSRRHQHEEKRVSSRRKLIPEPESSARRHSSSPGPSTAEDRVELHLSASPSTPPHVTSRRKSSTPRKLVKSTVTSVTVSSSAVGQGARSSPTLPTSTQKSRAPATPCRSTSSPSATSDTSPRKLTLGEVKEFLRSASREDRESVRQSLTPKSRSRSVQATVPPAVTHTAEGGVQIAAIGVNVQVAGPVSELRLPTP